MSDGEITDVTPLAGQDSVPREEWAGGFATVEDLFEHIERALDEGAHELEVRYDPSLGYPTQIWIDFDQQMVDEEISIQASDLEVIESQ